MTVILNTWIFENDIKKGIKQSDLINRVAKLKVDGIEVRREYFTSFTEELPIIASKAQESGLIVNYSVPDQIFLENGDLNPELMTYFDEGLLMGIDKIKFNLGSFNKFNGDLAEVFSAFPLEQITMNIENDQTKLSGSADALIKFLSCAKENNVRVGFVYDLGNWAFTKQDPIASADLLAPYTDYIHLKNTLADSTDNLKTSSDLEQGMYDWRRVLDHLPQDAPCAIEYPMENDALVESQILLLKKKLGE
ncbi:sugar phosphate isomerase [Latilactobacillus sakei]|nr:sugar phosphate isomerase/epimerase [Latilactobacillus sakei]AUX11638.1 sugar phosphate isomerase [Latilactobacillus sakei]